MLYYYQFLPKHTIYKLHQFYGEIVAVWCKADAKTTFSVTALFSRDCIDFFNYGPKALEEQARDLYSLFAPLSKATKKEFIKAWKENNEIKALCTNKKKGAPVTFEKLKSFDPMLTDNFIKKLKTFNTYMYKNVPAAKDIKDNYGSLKTHFDDLKKVQKQVNICPFCGLKILESQYGNTRDAYDHFLPKSKYPFNSINFHNLAPICDVCNEKHKKSKDPIHYEKDKNKGKRRLVFYPYSTEKIDIDAKLTISKKFDFLNPKKGDFKFTYTCKGKDEQIETWDEVFGANAQHSALVLDMRRTWLESVLIAEFEAIKHYAPGVVLDGNFIKTKTKKLKEGNPLVDFAFLKAAYFDVVMSSPDLMKVVKDTVAKRKP